MPTITRKDNEAEITLSDLVQVRRRFQRSVNLSRDFLSADPLDGYILTPSALLSLERIATGLEHDYARAINITGPYGSGKSAFALFAAKSLSAPDVGTAALRTRIREQEPELAERLFPRTSSGYWPVLISGVRDSIARAFIDGLLSSLRQSPDPAARSVEKEIRKQVGASLEAKLPTAHNVTSLYEMAAALACKKSPNCQGLLVIVDEAGKFLEYAAIHPNSGDVQVLQELAECAARSDRAPIMLITILHQAFEDYAHRLSAHLRFEWQKVQGRFIDIPFGDGPDETIRLIAQAIERKESASAAAMLEPALQRSLDQALSLHLTPATLSAGEYREVLHRAYPLHPLALHLIPFLFRKFGQNERSLFSFLSYEEPFGFQDFLRHQSLSSRRVPTLRVDHLYDYMTATFGATLYLHPTSKLWSECEDSLVRLRDRDPLQSRVLKTIALLHILGEQPRILPSREVLAFALQDEDTGQPQVDAAIDALEAGTLIAYRQFRRAYRLYEGSDIDVDSRLRDARVQFAQGTDVIRVARQLGQSPPIIARRHSYERGTLRSFEVHYCRPATLQEKIDVGPAQADGLLLLCLAADPTDLDTAQSSIPVLASGRNDVIVGLSTETEALHEAAIAVESLLRVRENTPELRNDRVASREVEERLIDAKNAFQEEWQRLLSPQKAMDATCLWYYQGSTVHIDTYRQLQELVSRACDEAFHASPRVRNELANRRHLSSQGAAARRSLIAAMIARRDRPRLGIEGFPPERSMYASILESTGIHVRIADDTWGFVPPTGEQDAALLEVWNAIEQFLFDGGPEPRSITLLNARLRSKPFGLTDGLIPILLCAVLIHNEAQVGIFEDGRFLTELDAPAFERLIKQPGDFTVQGCRIAGERKAVLKRFADGLLHPHEKPTVMNVARQIYRHHNRLQQFTLRTRKALDDDAIALRDLLKEGRQPEQLLFINLPKVLGAQPFSEFEDDTENVERFFSKWNDTYSAIVEAYPDLLNRIEKALCGEFSVGDWAELRLKAAIILPYVTDSKLSSFVLRAADENLDRGGWLASVATVVMDRPPDQWSDTEEAHFANQLPPLSSAFKNTLLVAFAKKQRVSGEDQIGMRIAVTLDNGAEVARVIIASRHNVDQIDIIARKLADEFRRLTGGHPQEIRLAAIAKATQDILRGENDG